MDFNSLVYEQLIFKSLESLTSQNSIQIEGNSSFLPLSLVLTQPQSSLLASKKHLLICEDETEMSHLQSFFDAKGIPALNLPNFDVSPYSGLAPKSNLSAKRLSFLHHISDQKSPYRIFFTTLNALSLKTLPLDFLKENTYSFKVGDELPEPIGEFLSLIGYKSVSIVEQPGQYSAKGGILDLYSPAEKLPLRIELFGDEIESLRFFEVDTQRSVSQAVTDFTIIPARETFYDQDNKNQLLKHLHAMTNERQVPKDDFEQIKFSILNERDFLGQEFLLSAFWLKTSLPKDFIPNDCLCWVTNKELQINSWQNMFESLNQEFQRDLDSCIRPAINDLYVDKSEMVLPDCVTFLLDDLLLKDIDDFDNNGNTSVIKYSTSKLTEFITKSKSLASHYSDLKQFLKEQFQLWNDQAFHIVLCEPQDFAFKRAEQLCSALDVEYTQIENLSQVLEQKNLKPQIFLTKEDCLETLKLNEEKIIYLKFKDLFGKNISKAKPKSSDDYFKKLDAIRFGEIKKGDLIVHVQHGIGCFEGLKIMPIQGVDSEFLEIRYKNNDKLYLPVHRINQIKLYNGPNHQHLLDKLGGTSWEKAKIKVKKHIRDVANDLLQIYAKRSLQQRPSYSFKDEDLFAFENEFPYDETEDQFKAIQAIRNDLLSDKPMDRLICGDVGFGKTEVAMRAAFQVLQSGKQVAVLAPTTVLTFQHFRSFKKRLEHWGFNVKSLNRFVPQKEIKQTLKELKAGTVDLIVGTHRLLSQDVEFNQLGLLICDEEQKFGVKHKEKIRRFKTEVDTLTLSATPIPRTLNMGLMGLRDLSIISTAPTDRQATRTFVTKFNSDIIKKAITTEIERGGQVYFVHNRIQSIYGLYDELKKLLPEARIAVGHGQMPEQELEKVMLKFFNHEIDVLLSTTIIESGVDIPNANTMFIDNAHQFGLSQLYQLRGRVGRSKNKAYCYLIIPKGKQIDKDALERLKVLQENTALGSGIRIAHYDLELRGTGNILGEDQSGHVNIVGYDLYMELLQQTIAEAKGQEIKTDLEPDINVPLPALIPSDYISDIRLRLSVYKSLSSIENLEEIDSLEEELKDQYGPLPEPVLNLFSMMLVKKLCKDKGIKEVSSGPKNLSLKFDSSTDMSIDRILGLTKMENKKYKLLPDDRLLIRMNEISWPRIYEEIDFL